MSIRDKAFKGVAWSVVQNWGSQAVSLVVFLILARLLTPEAFGLVALANVFIAFMQVFAEQGFTQALIQRRHLEPEHLDTAFWSNVGIGLLLTAVGFATSGLVAGVFRQPGLVPILQCFSFLFLINSLGHVHKAILSRELAFKTLAARTLIAVALSGVAGVSMAVSGFGVWSLIAQQVALETVGVLVTWTAVDWKPRVRFSRHHFNELFGFGANVVGVKFVKFFNRRSDNLLIGYFLGETVLGYYAIAHRILQVMTQLLVTTINQVALPTFAKLQAEPDRLRQAFYRATQFTSLLAFPAFAGVAMLAPELVVLVFGAQWTPSAPVMRVLAFAGMVYALSYFNSSIFVAMGKPSWRLRLTALEALITLLACLVAVRWGIVAVALAYVASTYLLFPVGLGVVKALIHVSLGRYLQQLATPALATAAMVLGILLRNQALPGLDIRLGLATDVLAGAVVYLLAVRLLDRELFRYLQALLARRRVARNEGAPYRREDVREQQTP